jgi:hypothetical protein
MQSELNSIPVNWRPVLALWLHNRIALITLSSQKALHKPHLQMIRRPANAVLRFLSGASRHDAPRRQSRKSQVFLTNEKRMLNSMKTKGWTDIAEKYNGRNQIGYDVKIENAYNSLKETW